MYLPKQPLEDALLHGLDVFLHDLTDRRVIGKVNDSLRQMWEDQTGYDPEALQTVQELERKLTNLRLALEEADDAEERIYLRSRIAQMKEEIAVAHSRIETTSEPLQLNIDAACKYVQNWNRLYAAGDAVIQKALIREVVQVVTLIPVEVAVDITFRVPDQIKNFGSESIEAEVSRTSGSGGRRRGGRERVFAIQHSSYSTFTLKMPA